MNKIPKHISILGHQVDIKLRQIADTHGEFLSDKTEIHINPNQSHEDQVKTLFHETIHAILHLTGWDNRLSEKTEEGITRALENGLWPLVQWRDTKRKR